MGVDTKLYISSKWEIRDIANVMETYVHIIKGSLIVKHANLSKSLMYSLMFRMENGDNRHMYVHPESDTPLGPCTTLSLSAWGEAVEIMTAIAKVLGGILEKEDCSGMCEMMHGSTWDKDGIPWFINEALIKGDMEDNDDIDGLVQFIKNWKTKHRS